MYHFTSSFLADHSTGRRLTDVDIVSGDGFFNRHILIDTGFKNEYLISDQFHLIDSGIVNIFGKYCVELLQGILVNTIQAQSEA